MQYACYIVCTIHVAVTELSIQDTRVSSYCTSNVVIICAFRLHQVRVVSTFVLITMAATHSLHTFMQEQRTDSNKAV